MPGKLLSVLSGVGVGVQWHDAQSLLTSSYPKKKLWAEGAHSWPGAQVEGHDYMWLMEYHTAIKNKSKETIYSLEQMLTLYR